MADIQSYKTEGMEIICLSDGGVEFAPKVFPQLDPNTWDTRLQAAGLDAARTSFNVYVLRHAQGAIDLVDTGCGPHFGPAGGALPAVLEGLDIAPSDIRNLIFTHLHADHAGGAVIDGQAVFDKAQVFVHKDDIAHFSTQDGPGADMLTQYAGRITPVSDGDILADGTQVWALPGHTPGHIGIKIGQDVALVGDIMHSFALQLPDPDIGPIYDVDAQQAAVTRRAALVELAQSGRVWSGSHGIGPRFLRAQADGAGFAVTPA